MMDRVFQWIGLGDDGEFTGEDGRQPAEPETEAERSRRRGNIVPLERKRSEAKVVIVEPRTFNEVKDIADHLRARKAVLVNFHRVPHELKQRMKDFLSGTIYVLEGEFTAVGEDIYLLAPENVEIEGSISLFADETLGNFRR
ncbi:cell division protein SepF [Brockia lithotrophica]|uniref:Cell division protein SepF n=1 Tax=Brockia lithotrophica TaxID=933949 RepID=A0A660L3H9_9BACL|nr:cell division protein SepF [Brockia lithotrophica]RKQ88497.1 cell division inhibitor SepF [Brockia lithotrophica]